ncbi:hypothetical protein NQ318_023050 [Aromia moschata]|uniref:Uncharacterized protein n=1 Tax=Aromia moschata TaxID=1265417 RepID=A0AAV8XYF2_9CUCU|nr:hypothetical protein NQ318_023050 [Aromia moschata]
METPTLNKKQQKSSLSAKKVRSKETIKNVLAPLIPPEDYIVLKQILEQNLPKITEKVRVPWRDIKNIPKADRKKFKEDYRKK